MLRPVGIVAACALGGLLIGGAASLTVSAPSRDPVPAPLAAPSIAAAQVIPSGPPAPPPPPTPAQALAKGVLIVVSKRSQKLFVFKDGQLWDSTPVSTGKPGDETPAGVFPILQKQVRHRSTLFHGASMPYMQRLTWDGVALHAGPLPGYRASHGCIRLPAAFAKKLYRITSYASTAVLVANGRAVSAEQALDVALAHSGQSHAPAALASNPPQPAPPQASVATPASGTETIQVGALPSQEGAARMWQALSTRSAELAALDHQIVPAVVHARQVYRLRASGPGAHGLCARLAAQGIACIHVARN